MAPPSDRIRRILSDAAPAPAPAPDDAPDAPKHGVPKHGVPKHGATNSDAPKPGAPKSDAAKSDAARARRLRERLRALGLDRPPAKDAPDHAPDAASGSERTWAGQDDVRPLEEQVEGRERATPVGVLLYAEKRIPLEDRHGHRPLVDALAHPIPLRPHERGPSGPSCLDAREAVFLDTETTGLSGGTGTVAFLVGTGRVEGDAFVVRQYCMRDFPEEAALLHALLGDLGTQPLVTFNGRSFDWPLLTTRLRLHRMRPGTRAHYDLLPPSRRLWVDSVPSHTLGDLEEHVLGLERVDDLPGWRIPQAFFDYMRTGQGGLVAEAFRHNVTDVVSMLALLGEVGAILDRPASRPSATPRDHYGTARLLLDLGLESRALSSLEAGIAAKGVPVESTLALRRLQGHVHRRAGRHADALAAWKALAREAPRLDVEAFEQVAKIYEHRERDFASALAWVEEALTRVAPASRAEDALRHREQRLRRRLAAQACPPRTISGSGSRPGGSPSARA